jgi:hypothetical protein
MPEASCILKIPERAREKRNKEPTPHKDIDDESLLPLAHQSIGTAYKRTKQQVRTGERKPLGRH